MPTPDFLLRFGLSPQAKVLDLKSRVRCRRCGAKGRAVVSVKWGSRAGEPRLPSAPESARDWCGRSGELGYHKTAEANEVTAAQSARHSPSDKRDIPIQDATLISRGCGRAGLQSTIE